MGLAGAPPCICPRGVNGAVEVNFEWNEDE
jgi:hypothetical protein